MSDQMRTKLSNGAAAFAFGCLAVAAFAVVGIGSTPVISPAAAQGAGDVTEKDAFDAAKELGNIEAWEAFLNSFPTGFRADLARAYVRRLGKEEQSAAPQPPKAQKPKPAQQSVLPTFAAGPGSAPWRVTQYELDEGNSVTTAAAVKSEGLEFLMYCDTKERLSAILREGRRGVYPDFDTRISQGLAAKRGSARDDESARIPMRFSGGSEYSVSAIVEAISGEVRLGINSRGSGFRTSGRLVEDIMGESSFTLDAPPFQGTFQLTASRKAICSVLRTCGAAAPGCGSSSTTRKTTTKRSASVKCSGGYIRKGKCKCGKGRVRVKKGRNNYACQRRSANPNSVCKRGYFMFNGKCKRIKAARPPKRKLSCGDKIPGCVARCSTPACRLDCNQMCSAH